MRTLRMTPFLVLAVAACGDDLRPDQPPAVADLSLRTAEDAPVVLPPTTTDPDGAEVALRYGAPAHGTLRVIDGRREYLPAPDYAGVDRFEVSASDGLRTATATVTVEVTPVNDPPRPGADAFATAEDAPLDIDVATLLANDVDVDSPTMSIAELGHAAGGKVALVDTVVHFVPDRGWSGTAAFSYMVSDGESTAAGAVEITVGGVDDPPVAVADRFDGTEDTPVVLTTQQLTGNDTDDDGDTLAVVAVGDVVGGTIAMDRDQLTFIPDRDRTDDAGFTYVVTDGRLADTGAVTIALAAVDDPPEAVAADVAVVEDTPATFTLAGVDVDSADLRVTVTSAPLHGTLTVDGATATYQPARDFHGDDKLSFAVSDGTTSSGAAVVRLTVASVVECGDGEVEGSEACDDGNDDDRDGCLASCALAKCGDGVVQAGVEECDDGNASDADGCLTTCEAAKCGDGVVQVGVEECDDGNPSNTDGCLVTCKAAACGDGLVWAGHEDCDDANRDDGDACPSTCAAATCGDGFVWAGHEACDDGNADDGDGCPTSCQPATCGDGFVERGVEACDDGNTDDGDGCPTSCEVAVCGDGFVWAGHEACDDGNDVETDGCRRTCDVAVCGDGVVWAGHEVCDDGNDDDTDGCLATCQAPGCGDGVVWAGHEACDDGNADDSDGCLTSCQVATCGDGVVWAGHEACDDGNESDGDGCLTTCQPASCGDGFLWPGHEACDDGNTVDTDGCPTTCQPASCGDGFVWAGHEGCDDGNADDGDACPTSCQPASCGDGFVWAGHEACDDGNAVDTDQCRATCVAATCGDGVVWAGVEQCDDGNTVPDDSCDNRCQATTPPVCGDGTVDAGEACDDGNVADQDGCSHACAVETCGDGLIQYGLGEICDDGNTADGDGCSATCQLEGGFTTVAPQLISGALGCDIYQSNTGRKIAVDGLGKVYVVMQCGGQAYAAVSPDRGVTWGVPVDLGITGISEIAIAAGPPGVAYVAASGNGQTRFTRTGDAGATWSTPIDLATNFDFEISIEAFNDDVFVGIGGGSGVLVLHNGDRGVGAFTTVDVAVSQVFFDLLYDDRQGTLLVCADTPDFHVRTSADRGATFTPEVNPAGYAFFSDWGVGDGTIFVAGTSGGSDVLTLIPAADPAQSSTVTGLPVTNQSNQRTVTADVSGNAYIASVLDTGEVQLDRLVAPTHTFATPRTIVASGTYPGITALPTSNGVAMIYASNGGVYATIQVY